MDDTELQARFAGLRLAVAAAIKAACRGPADLAQQVAALREVEAAIPGSVHPAARDEILGVITALTRMPVRDPAQPRPVPAGPALPPVGPPPMPSDLLP